jgi:hypothetical protein
MLLPQSGYASMSQIALTCRMILATMVLPFLSAGLRPAAAADGDSLWASRAAARGRQTGSQSELRLAEPKRLSSSRPVYSTAQSEPVPPGPNLGGPAPRNETPPMQSLPPNAREAEAIDPSWKPIGAVSVTITNPMGDLPADLAAPVFARAGVVGPDDAECRNWMEFSYFWMASGFCSGPLYFEEPNLERYGYQFACLQPAVSAAHFFATIPVLPYKMVVHPPCECIYSLGYYRPGSCAPLQHERFHLEPAAAAETGAVIGLILLIGS